MISRRDVLLSSLFGAGYVGLRALATGLPAALLLDPRRALAAVPEGGTPPLTPPQFVVFCTSSHGDPISASVPGSYVDPNIVHSPSAAMAPTSLTLAGRPYTAAAPWAALPQSVLDRACFWHIATGTPVHPKEPDVLGLMTGHEMLPSLLAKQLAPALGTTQAQPVCIGADSPSEALSYAGQTLPIVPPIALKATLTTPGGPLANLQSLRDQTMNELYAIYRDGATTAQKAYIDSLVTSQAQVRSIDQTILSTLSSIKDNSVTSQVLAAVALIRMKVSPVVSIHIPFGADNHSDPNLATETSQTLSGVQAIGLLMQTLASAGLADMVSFMSLNVFGRTLGKGSEQGRNHNPNHQVSVTIGKPFQGGVIGGVAPYIAPGGQPDDYAAVSFDSKTGAPSAGGDVQPTGNVANSLLAFGQTMLAAVGVDAATIQQALPGGVVVSGALASS